MAEIISAQNVIQSQLIDNFPNMVGSAIGEKMVFGKPTGDEAVLVFVEEKLPESDVISKYSADAIIPKMINGVPVDIIEVGKIQKQSYSSRVRPIRPGYSCSHGAVSAGTIGGFFTDRDGDKVILSNNHVLANENKASIGDIIYQPGIHDQKGVDLSFDGWNHPASKPYIAKLKKFNSLRKEDNYHDSAIASLPPEVLNNNLVDLRYPFIEREIVGVVNPQVNMSVQKCGRTTGYTTGRIIGINGKFTIEYDFGAATFVGCIVTTSMSAGGDSGSLIMDLSMNAVGLLFAGSDKVTLASPIQKVMAEYGLSLWSNNIVSTDLSSDRWNKVMSNGSSISVQNNTAMITAMANTSCYLEQQINKHVDMVSCEVFSGNDGGATWGTGMVLTWGNKSLKINLRSGGSFGAYFDGTEYTGVGNIKPNTWYNLRIVFADTVRVEAEELYDSADGNWSKIIELPRSVVSSMPDMIRIGKTDMYGGGGNNSEPGTYGVSKITNIKIK